MNFILSISGQKGSGKDTAADYICEKYKFKKYAFADPIKKLAQDIFRFSHETLWGESSLRDLGDERYPIDDTKEFLKPRTVLTTFGDAGRACYKNIWAEKTMYDINSMINYNSGEWNGHIISDLRMKNEMDVVKKHGGKIIRIKRNNEHITSTHISETEQLEIPDSDFDYIIDNSGTLNELKVTINKCMGKLGMT